MLLPDTDNDAFKKAVDLINNTRLPVFLTGKAGTGKTTFLRYIRDNTHKNTAVVAPTGVAAINAGGTTIHSFFQLPFGPYLPNGKNNLPANFRLSAERREVLESLELLIIDEISMVRCDMLDAIDAVLKYCRREHGKPYGGVQVLYIGDLFQLPPVNNSSDWQLLSTVYKCPYFFGSHVVTAQLPVFVELNKVYRQKDSSFLNLLNRVRNNKTNSDDFDLLETRFMPSFKPALDKGFITLTAHNSTADKINTDAIHRLEGMMQTFDASVNGTFPESAYPAEFLLKLKAGAQVMFLKNDTEKIRRYYNGKIGIIKEISDEKIWVECTEEAKSQLIEVKREVWRNTRYILNTKTQKVEEEELGAFTQFPLRLAWAITIHKSQGLTFEKTIIDAGNAFSPGQVYVALSRCTSLNGITLLSRIPLNKLASDKTVVAFIESLQQKKSEKEQVDDALFSYQHETVTQLFSYTNASEYLQKMINILSSNSSFGKNANEWIFSVEKCFRNIEENAQKFISLLNNAFAENNLYLSAPAFAERFKKAVAWFLNEISKQIIMIEASSAITDNRQLAKEFNELLHHFFKFFMLRKYLLNGCINGFSLEDFFSHKAKFIAPDFNFNAYSGQTKFSANTENKLLYEQLKTKRNELAGLKNMPVFLICKTQSLEDMANLLPRNIEQLGMIKGFGAVKLKNYGNQFIDIINNYCEENQIAAQEMPAAVIKVKKRVDTTQKSDTKNASFELYKSGLSIPEIARQRNLAQSTIETHLCYFIETGVLELDSLITKEKQDKISLGIDSSDNQSLLHLKEMMPNASFAEIKWVLANKKKIIRVGSKV